MQALIPPRFYFDAGLFEHEREMLFRRVWQMAGFVAELAASDDFVTAEIGGRSVVVQNFGGELRAFANVCSHRSARIHCEARGNGPLRCPYHGWIYNREGVPYSIPARPRFDELRDRGYVQNLALRPYDVEVCGGLVFVRERVDGPSLAEYLGDAAATVEAMTAALGDRISRDEWTVKANWKVLTENTLEAYHVGFVHEETFKKLSLGGMDFRFQGTHSGWASGVDEATAKRMKKIVKLGRMPYPVDGYFHQFVFPNLTFSTLAGTTFGFQVFRPVSATETRIESHLFLSRMDAGAEMAAVAAEMLSGVSGDFSREVIMEDVAVCEAVQLGLPEAGGPGMLSEEEERVGHFQDTYMRYMTGEVPAEHAALAEV
ncbi:MAG TPA: aromatic ring-hydroxylating dioxygenase subunit alpha [Longimicrobium sp.]|jgi:phenylpropionate dioxygenase-like ring-hydroxylating dioxygenase large terminal subunit